MIEVAQFPLQSVLLPGIPLRLHVFEPRYLRLLDDVADADNQFGVVLITRGSEVGGNEQRADVGTMARMRQQRNMGGDRWLVEVEGTERFRIISWLSDAPYPRATIELWPQSYSDGDGVAEAVTIARRAFDSFVELTRTLGRAAGPISINAEPVAALNEMTAMVPISAYDRYQVLAAGTVPDAAFTLTKAIVGASEIMRLQFGLA